MIPTGATIHSCYTVRRMPSPPPADQRSARALGDPRPVLFVAREPDETLRTFLPVIDHLRASHGLGSRVLFHHEPGSWAHVELRRRALGASRVFVPEQTGGQWPGPVAESRLGRTVSELARLRVARQLAQAALERERPSAVVVIQDTLLFERFLVREANYQGLPTLVVQWAFNFPQPMYDRLRTVQNGAPRPAERRGVRRLTAPLTRAAYRMLLRGLGLSFDLAESYGGGEARLFAVMGEAFEAQYRAQGVRNKRIVVTGHPAHDVAHSQAAAIDARARAAIRARYRLPADGPMVLYATQPVLWRRVMTPDQLRASVRAIAAAVAGLPGLPHLVLKLHPRERPEEYAFCADLNPPVRVIADAEMAELIAASDLFVSSSSSTVLLAMMLDRPIVTVNLDSVPHFDAFEEIGGTLHVRTPEAFAAAAAQALADLPTRERLQGERKAVLARYTRFDGRATERIATLIVDAVAEARRTSCAA